MNLITGSKKTILIKALNLSISVTKDQLALKRTAVKKAASGKYSAYVNPLNAKPLPVFTEEIKAIIEAYGSDLIKINELEKILHDYEAVLFNVV